MQYQVGRLSAIFHREWRASAQIAGFSYESKNLQHLTQYRDIQDICLGRGFIWRTVTITIGDQSLSLKGLTRKNAKQLVHELTTLTKQAIIDLALAPEGPLSIIEFELNRLTATDKYLSHTNLKHGLARLESVDAILEHPFFDPALLTDRIQSILNILRRVREPRGGYIKELNEQFIRKAIKQYAPLFSSLEEFPLSEEQMRAVVTNEDRNLLIAAAGSGKTSTIVARAIYLICAGLAKPEEILILAYNRDAQAELQQRLVELQGVLPCYQQSPKVKTFHGYGYELLAETSENSPAITKYATAKSKQQSQLFAELMRELYNKDVGFKAAWTEFLLVDKYPAQDVFKIKTKREYESYLQELGAIRRRLPEGYRLMIPTIDGKEVRSIEEARIANWLALKGVTYEYEPLYASVTDPEKNFKYNPDFFYPEVGLYHEHFAISAEGKTPPFIGDEYLEGIRWKRNTHAENGTKLIETHSAHFRDGTVFERLESALQSHNVPHHPLDKLEIDRLVGEAFRPEVDTSLFISFLHHFKANNTKFDMMHDKIDRLPDRRRTKLFITVFKKLYEEYSRQLEKNCEIDFEDQIDLACDLLESNKHSHQFKHVLVDEFQDTSQDRKRMLQALLSQNKEAKLFCVGDDWQSIYRFAGADIEIMTHFASHFGATATNYLTQTYRSFRGIVDVAAQFVQRNDAQIRKQVSAIKDIEKDQVVIYGYHDTENQMEQLQALLGRLSALEVEHQLSVFLLARYNHLQPKNITRYRNLDLQFSTIHAAKGLQADYVILLNVETGTYGFPSTIADDPLMQLVLPDPETYAHAEERRLLYVALTRAKRGAFIFSNNAKVSPFVLELSKMQRVKSDSLKLHRENPCPECQMGELTRRVSKFGAFYGCSNFPSCEYTEAAICPSCETGKLVYKTSKHGPFIGCSMFPRCEYTESLTFENV